MIVNQSFYFKLSKLNVMSMCLCFLCVINGRGCYQFVVKEKKWLSPNVS